MNTHAAFQASGLDRDQPYRLPVGERLYAIGDVHGRLDLLEDLLAAVRVDNGARTAANVKILLLGDMIDRGNDGAAVIRACMRLTSLSDNFVVLKGNHEVMMIQAYRGSHLAMGVWLRGGGDATLYSFGVSAELIDEGDPAKLSAAMRDLIPGDVIRWLNRLPVTYRAGDYFFVHAGVRPGITLARQRDEDMLWIKEEFTEDLSRHPMMIVHGHSECDGGPEMRTNRIGLDTAAYRTDILTALGLEGQRRWTMNTCERTKSRYAHCPDAPQDRNASCAILEIVRDIVPLSGPHRTPTIFRAPGSARFAGMAASVLAIVLAVTWLVVGSKPASLPHSIESTPIGRAYVVMPHTTGDPNAAISIPADAPVIATTAGTDRLDRRSPVSHTIEIVAGPERILDRTSSKNPRSSLVPAEAAGPETAALGASSRAASDDAPARPPALMLADAGGTTTAETAKFHGATVVAAPPELIRVASPMDNFRRRQALDLIRSLRRQ